MRDDIYVCDTGNRRVQVLDPKGHFLRMWPLSHWVYGIALLDSLVFAVSCYPEAQLLTFDELGQLVRIMPIRNPRGLCALEDSIVLWEENVGVDPSMLSVLGTDGTLLRQVSVSLRGVELLISNTGELLCVGDEECHVFTADLVFVRTTKDVHLELFWCSTPPFQTKNALV
jgi:hypothetical protein